MLYQLWPLADEFKQIRGKTIAWKKLAQEKGKEEKEELGGMILTAPPVLSLQKRPFSSVDKQSGERPQLVNSSHDKN